ncbi:hypothetical protein B0H66DRAFT_107998 [Apodospora peruviana]|uniref:Uncharacterized protein n=1 Tax=Apodospora peruviana TaxID=516989 RepID=A0AAE0IGY7_9PEZI|nr:hypothetical protein B0H66DRAFT_107998 [Apodospora peruviana]
MDQVLFEHLLEDSTLFAPTGGHRAIEIHRHHDCRELQIKESNLTEKQLVSWCRDTPSRPREADDGTSTGSQSDLFRLLVCSPRVLDRDIWPLPVSSSTLAGMLGSHHIPPIFARAVCRHVPLATSFESLLNTGDDSFGILLRTNLSHTWQYALALVHDPQTRTTTGILFGLRSTEIEAVLQSVRHSAKDVISCPAILPCILVDRGLDEVVKDAEKRRRSLTEIRIETGSQGFHQASLMRNDQWDDRDDLDLDVLMQKLTSLSDACSGISAVCKMQRNFVEAISEFEPRLLLFQFNSTVGLPDTKSSRYARQQLRFFSQFLEGIESKVTYTKSSVQDQVQTIYTLISQRDSRNHMALARTTRRLAELSRKDSTDMRVISAVTLVFLPATFTSTFFSASFFNFQPGGGGDHVSVWIWLYCVVTVLLTLFVLASWWYFSRRQHAKAVAAARRESKFHHDHGQQADGDGTGFESSGKYFGTADTTAASATGNDETVFNMAMPMGRRERGRMDDFRPYLGGSIAEGMFARKVSFLPDSNNNTPTMSPTRAETANISPTATGFR